ncbi:MAG: hypothetical protein CO093_03755 [Alphaproteobacteria bacterium CG_4_9_14_3_um_filter_47_13]|nr:MAG: hypothetical protein CO093_03755 [Alphaproteobacteria bacterium CG_4_9_14_3_um_filter_47_13]
MEFSLKKAFASTMAAVVLSTTGCATMDTNSNTEPLKLTTNSLSAGETKKITDQQEAELLDILSKASDATNAKIRYNKYFLKDTIQDIKANYVQDKTDEELNSLALAGARKLVKDNSSYTIAQFVEATLDGILTKLDPHSDYLTPDETANMFARNEGNIVGIGVKLDYDENRKLLIIEDLSSPDSPAAQAGLKKGDLISHINGNSMYGKTSEDVIKLIKGEKGTKINITIDRPGSRTPLEFEITRAKIEMNPVTYKALGDIGYVRLHIFNERASGKVQEAVQELQKSIDNIKGYILDLRRNPGGLLNEAINVTDRFLEEGDIVSSGKSPESVSAPTKAKAGDITHGAPIVILVDGGSASASEIVAEALQDHKRAIIIGNQTYGKSSVQTVRPLPVRLDGIKFTTEYYFTASGDTLQNRGVIPDIATGFYGTLSDGRFNHSEGKYGNALPKPDPSAPANITRSFCDSSGTVIDLDKIDDTLLLKSRKTGKTEADMQIFCAIEHLKGQENYTRTRDLTPDIKIERYRTPEFNNS